MTKTISFVQLNNPPPPKVERILPPAEMIATFDRLRNQSSSTSLHFIVNDDDRPALANLDFNRIQSNTKMVDLVQAQIQEELVDLEKVVLAFYNNNNCCYHHWLINLVIQNSK